MAAAPLTAQDGHPCAQFQFQLGGEIREGVLGPGKMGVLVEPWVIGQQPRARRNWQTRVAARLVSSLARS